MTLGTVLDVQHLTESFLGSIFAAGIAWGVMKTEMRFLREWLKSHDEKDDRRFSEVNARVDSIFVRNQK